MTYNLNLIWPIEIVSPIGFLIKGRQDIQTQFYLITIDVNIKKANSANIKSYYKGLQKQCFHGYFYKMFY